MMTENNLPAGLRRAQTFVQPLQLFRSHLVRIEREEFEQDLFVFSRAFGEVVVAPAPHIEVRISGLKLQSLDDVVIAERGVEFDSGLEQVLVRLLEAGFDQSLLAFLVDVVAEHERELEGRLFAMPDHLAGHGELRLIAGAGVADDGESNDRFGAVLVLRRRDYRQGQQEKNKDERFKAGY